MVKRDQNPAGVAGRICDSFCCNTDGDEDFAGVLDLSEFKESGVLGADLGLFVYRSLSVVITQLSSFSSERAIFLRRFRSVLDSFANPRLEMYHISTNKDSVFPTQLQQLNLDTQSYISFFVPWKSLNLHETKSSIINPTPSLEHLF